MIEKLFYRVSYLVPPRWVSIAKSFLVKGGFTGFHPRYFVGLAVVSSLVFGTIATTLASAFSDNLAFVAMVGLSSLFANLIVFYFLLTVSAYQRAQKIEALLPDALRIISSNIRAGMTLENAMWSAARPEFGPLKDEISKVSADTFGGKSVDEALLEMPRRVDSRILERAIKLIVEGIKLGGRMTDLLDRVAEDITSSQNLQRQIATSTTTYSIFILFAALAASPVLFSVSTFYAQLNEKTLASFSASPAGDLGKFSAQAGGVASRVPAGFLQPRAQAGFGITFTDIRLFSIAVLVTTSYFAALIMSQIKDGDTRKGLAYVPVFIIASVSVYLLCLFVLEGVFSGLV